MHSLSEVTTLNDDELFVLFSKTEGGKTADGKKKEFSAFRTFFQRTVTEAVADGHLDPTLDIHLQVHV